MRLCNTELAPLALVFREVAVMKTETTFTSSK